MNAKKPNSDDFIFALEALGFDVEDEDEDGVTLSDGSFTVNVAHSISEDNLETLREHLDDVFSAYQDQVSELVDDYESDDYDENVKRIADWLNRG